MNSLRVFMMVLLQRPLIVILLALFYILDVILAVTANTASKPVIGLLMLLLIPTTGIFAMSTERIRALAVSSEELGIPSYRSRLVHVQWGVIAVFLVLPISGLMAAGGSPLLTSLLVAPAAFGVLFVLFGSWVILGAVGLVVLNKLGTNLGDLFFQPWAQFVLVAAGAWVLTYWLKNLLRPRYLARRALPQFADSRQDETARTVADAMGAKVDEVERYYQVLDERINGFTEVVRHGSVSLKAMWFGLGVDTEIRARPICLTIGIGAVALGLWHAIYGHKSEFGGYILLTSFAAISALTRIEALSRTLRGTVVEQSVLVLTPSWPNRQQLKIYVLKLICLRLVVPWLVWCVVTTGAVFAGWIATEWALYGAISYVAAASAAVTCLLIELIRKSTRLEKLLNSSLLLSSVIGAVIWIFGATENSGYQLFGILLIVIPLVVAAGSFWMINLRFPVTSAGTVS